VDKIILDNTVSSYLLFLLAVLSGAVISFGIFFLCKKFKGRMFRRMKSIGIMLLMSVAMHLGSQFFDMSTDVYHFAFTASKILYVLAFSWLFVKLSYIFIERMNSVRQMKDTMHLSGQIAGLLKKASLFFFGAVSLSMVLNILGFNIFSIVTGLGIGGLAVALGAQEILANIIGGITIFVSGIIKPGDFIEIDSFSGYISDIGMRTTKIKRLDGKTVIMPNSQIIKSTIINHTVDDGIMQTYVLPLKYSMKADQIKHAADIVAEILMKDSRIKDKKSISVGFYKFDVNSANLYVSFVIPEGGESGAIKEEFHYMVKHRFDAEGIEFAYPTQTIELVNKKQ